MKSGVLSTLFVLLLVAGLAPARAQRLQIEPCKVLRRDGAAILQQPRMHKARRKTVAADGTSEYVVSGVLFGSKASASLISSSRDEKASNANYALFGVAMMLFVAPAPAKR